MKQIHISETAQTSPLQPVCLYGESSIVRLCVCVTESVKQFYSTVN